jgi:hypothetical protein
MKPDDSRLTPYRELAAIALILFVGFLGLPVAYGAEIWGVMPGYIVCLAILPLFIPVLLIPASCLVALWGTRKSRYSWAALLAFLALLVPAYITARQGLMIDAFISQRHLFASGLLCWLLSALLMTLTWSVAAAQSERAI